MPKHERNEWKLFDAKNKLSELVNRAINDGPQHIKRNKDEVVVLSIQEFERLTGKKKDFLDFLRSAPSFAGLNLERDKSLGREFEF